MFVSLFGSVGRERVLIYLLCRKEGYAREITRFYSDISLVSIQKQLERLEEGGILVCKDAGRTRLFSFNPRYPLLGELKSLLEKALSFYPEEEQNRLRSIRTRPRRKNKPL